MRKGGRDAHVDQLVHQPGRAREVDDAVALGPAHQLRRVLAGRAGHQHLLDLADHALGDGQRVGLDGGLQFLQALHLGLVGRRVFQRRRRRAGARAEDEAEGGVEADVLHQLHQLGVVVVGLAGEADDKVAGQAQVGADGAQLAHDALELQRGVAALHRHQDAVAAVLHRQVQVVHELRDLAVGLDEARAELVGVAGREAQALDARNFGGIFQQQGQVGELCGTAHLAAVGIDVLAEQVDLHHTLVGQAGDLGQHIFERA
mmetsp:Transcript_53758/g.126759  ORF Transcript_53758/g.126759 Transcript_53758/m.126759 type:complete len:260 (+) Transcript_53758:1313-2092(+)